MLTDILGTIVMALLVVAFVRTASSPNDKRINNAIAVVIAILLIWWVH